MTDSSWPEPAHSGAKKNEGVASPKLTAEQDWQTMAALRQKILLTGGPSLCEHSFMLAPLYAELTKYFDTIPHRELISPKANSPSPAQR